MYCAFVVLEEVLGWKGCDGGSTDCGGACAALDEDAAETLGVGGPIVRFGAGASLEEAADEAAGGGGPIGSGVWLESFAFFLETFAVARPVMIEKALLLSVLGGCLGAGVFRAVRVFLYGSNFSVWLSTCFATSLSRFACRLAKGRLRFPFLFCFVLRGKEEDGFGRGWSSSGFFGN